VAAELALVARFYERLGDHAVNLARRSAARTRSAGRTYSRPWRNSCHRIEDVSDVVESIPVKNSWLSPR
jgi:phosphate uptake regulator